MNVLGALLVTILIYGTQVSTRPTNEASKQPQPGKEESNSKAGDNLERDLRRSALNLEIPYSAVKESLNGGKALKNNFGVTGPLNIEIPSSMIKEMVDKNQKSNQHLSGHYSKKNKMYEYEYQPSKLYRPDFDVPMYPHGPKVDPRLGYAH